MRRRRLLHLGAVTFVAAQLVLPPVLVAARDRLLFFPSQRPTAAARLPHAPKIHAELFEVPRPDGHVLVGYDVRPFGAADAPVLLCFHGNGGNVGSRANWVADLARGTGVRVVLAEYSGYGGCGGEPDSDGFIEDALAFHDRLTAEGVDPRQIVLFGESLGGVAALAVANERPSAGVITQSTFSSLSSMAWRRFGFLPLTALLARGKLDNAARAAQLDVPLLVVHGTDDEIVPFAESERLAAATERAERHVIRGAHHNDMPERGGREYLALLRERVRDWTAR